MAVVPRYVVRTLPVLLILAFGAGLLDLPGVAGPPAARAAAPVRIMVTGDSLSHGSSGDWTWRYRLAKHLTANGVTADFVGPRADLDNIMTPATGDGDMTYADPAFDRDHNALWARLLRDEALEIGADVAAHQPAILLVLLGINDLSWGRSPAVLEGDLRTFIANARGAKADISIVLGTMLPTRRAVDDPAFAVTVSEYNSRLGAVATELATPSAPIVVAGTADEFVPAEHTWDGVHPNARGELRVAAAFADTLSSAFAIGATYRRPYPQVAIGPRQRPRVTVTATGPGTADLAWTPSAGATQYWVWTRDDVVNTEWVRLPYPLSQQFNPWHMTQLIAGNTYRYKVQAAKGDNAGATSTETRLTAG